MLSKLFISLASHGQAIISQVQVNFMTHTYRKLLTLGIWRCSLYLSMNDSKLILGCDNGLKKRWSSQNFKKPLFRQNLWLLFSILSLAKYFNRFAFLLLYFLMVLLDDDILLLLYEIINISWDSPSHTPWQSPLSSVLLTLVFFRILPRAFLLISFTHGSSYWGYVDNICII